MARVIGIGTGTGGTGWPLTKIASLGQAAPGVGGNITSFDTPTVNARNQVTFSGFFQSDNPYGPSGNGFFRSTAGLLTSIAYDQQNIPQLGGPLSSTNRPAMYNAKGTAAYLATDASGAMVIALQPEQGPPTVVAKTGTSIPGVSGGVFNNFQLAPFGVSNLSLNFSDDVAFLANFSDNSGFHQGVFFKPHDGPVRLIASDEAPMGTSGFFICNNPDVATVTKVWVNNNGDIAFFAQNCGDVGPSAGIFIRLKSGTFVQMPFTGLQLDQAPPPMTGMILNADMGAHAFRANGNLPSWAMTLSADGPWAVISQTLGSAPVILAQSGHAAPGTQGTFQFFFPPQLGSGGGKVAFVALINGDPQFRFGIYESPPEGGLSTVALLTAYPINEGPQGDEFSVNQQGNVTFVDPTQGVFLAINPAAGLGGR